MALENIVGRGKQPRKFTVPGAQLTPPAPAQDGSSVQADEDQDEPVQSGEPAVQQLTEACLEAGLRFHFFHIHCRSPNFVGLHEFYGDAYGALYNWFDRFAERARAEGAEAATFAPRVPVVTDDCLGAAAKVVSWLGDMAAEVRDAQTPTAQAMIDELTEYLGKLAWQIDAQSNP